MTIDTRHLRELMAKADSPPWNADTKQPYDCVIWGNNDPDHFIANVDEVLRDKKTADGDVVCFDTSVANTELIVAAINALPALLDSHDRVVELLLDIEHLRDYVGVQDLMSDFRTAKEMRDAYYVALENAESFKSRYVTAQTQLAAANARVKQLESEMILANLIVEEYLTKRDAANAEVERLKDVVLERTQFFVDADNEATKAESERDAAIASKEKWKACANELGGVIEYFWASSRLIATDLEKRDRYKALLANEAAKDGGS